MTKRLLTQQQRLAGLYTIEDDHTITICNAEHETVAVFSATAPATTIYVIQKAADKYLLDREIKSAQARHEMEGK